MRRRDVLALGVTTLPLWAAARNDASAQSKYPDRPIRLVIPFPPGGSFDAVGRPWADRMKPLLGTVVIENQGGGGSSLGAAAVARSQPDGYTILLGGGGALVINPIASSRPPYDPVRDFEPIASGLCPRLRALGPSVATGADTARSHRLRPQAIRGKMSYGVRGCRLGEPSHRRAVQVAHGAAGHRAHSL